MIKLHTHIIGNTEIEPLNFCGKTIGWMLHSKDGMFTPPVAMQPIEGEHNLNTCEGCNKQLTELSKQFTLWIEGKHKVGAKPFPYCCKWHEQLLNVKEFNRAYFNGVPEMSAKKVVYTNQLIINKHNTENWYKVITDYIEITVESFGQMPTGCGAPVFLSDYLIYVTDLLNRNKEIQAEKKSRLLEFLNTYQTPNESPKTDFNILLSTYQKWLKEFPFELNSYFGNLKQHFEKQLPILNGKPEVNIYSGMAKAKMHTKSSLIEALINLNKELLSKINVRELVEKGIISDLNKHRFELESESLRIATSQITKDFSKSELQYIKALKKWLNLHKEYFKEIAPLLKALPPQQTETKTEQETIEMKPVLKPEAVQMVFDILKDFFSPEQQTELKQIIETGNKANKKLLFKGNGNRLTDTFKKLIEHDFITGCQKQDLINWIISNFTFTQQNKVKAFVYDTVEKTISRNYYPCKSPLIEIKSGQIQRIEQPRTKKYR